MSFQWYCLCLVYFFTLQEMKKFSCIRILCLCLGFTADVRQPWTNPQDLYFEYLIIRVDYLIIPFDYSIIGWNKANL